MQLIVGNPAGWWALAAVPAILLIHFLQHEARRVRASTLFLLEHLGQESTEGRVFDRIRNSAALWLQLLAALLLTWLLLEPRWVQGGSVQRVAVVLDSSVSMSAFAAALQDRLPDELRALDRAAATTEWRLIESDPGRRTLYAGSDLAELTTRLAAWRPRLGTHDVEPALRAGRRLAGNDGVVIFATDHVPEGLPADVSWVAVGEPVDNVGFAGLRTERGEDGGTVWEALLRNYGTAAQERTWSVEAEGLAAEPRVLRLEPGEMRRLSGPFPPGQEAFSLVLAPDRFALDDRLPVIRPLPKQLAVSLAVEPAIQSIADRLVDSIEDSRVVPRAADPDLEVISYRPGVLPGLDLDRVCFVRTDSLSGDPEAAPVVGANHPLVEGLGWQGLLCGPAEQTVETNAVQVLVWRGAEPLIYLRAGRDGARQLVVAFDLMTSNADRLPAFVLMMHRFAESVRAAKRAPEQANVEVGQRLAPAIDPEGGAVIVRGPGGEETRYAVREAALLRAPAEPGHFEVTQDEVSLLRAAARFADVREADLRGAASGSRLEDAVVEARRAYSQPDPLAPLWLLLALAALMGSWAVSGGGASAARRARTAEVRS